MPTRPSRKVTAAELVVAQVRGLIERGEVRSGDRLPPERELAQQLGVSRPSVRSGLKSLAAMGVLVDPRAKDEQANIVAFSGNPTTAADNRYLINAQPGDYDVVSADPGVFPETALLTLENGQVSRIDRVRGSSQLTPGTWVLSDEQLRKLGSLVWQISQVYPVDHVPSPNSAILLDTEWKILSDGRWVVKQVRPFLKKQ